MQGTIEAVNRSQSGKTLGVKVGEQWYTTKNWELEQKVGTAITFEPSSSEFNGKVMYWLNDYVEVGASTTPSAQAFDAAHANYTPTPPPGGSPTPVPGSGQMPPQSAPAPQTPQSSTKDRDSFIAAQALCKTLTFESAQDALNAFKYLYIQLRDWNPEAPADDGVPYDDQIPF